MTCQKEQRQKQAAAQSRTRPDLSAFLLSSCILFSVNLILFLLREASWREKLDSDGSSSLCVFQRTRSTWRTISAPPASSVSPSRRPHPRDATPRPPRACWETTTSPGEHERIRHSVEFHLVKPDRYFH